jgi:hypothetical protein
VTDLVAASPDLNEARARKCVLALAAAKIVRSDNSTVRRDRAAGLRNVLTGCLQGTVLYRWLGPPDR